MTMKTARFDRSGQASIRRAARCFTFKQPSAAELEHDFLWRTTCRVLERGHPGRLQGDGTGLSQARCEAPTGTALDTHEVRKVKTRRDADNRELTAEPIR